MQYIYRLSLCLQCDGFAVIVWWLLSFTGPHLNGASQIMVPLIQWCLSFTCHYFNGARSSLPKGRRVQQVCAQFWKALQN